MAMSKKTMEKLLLEFKSHIGHKLYFADGEIKPNCQTLEAVVTDGHTIFLFVKDKPFRKRIYWDQAKTCECITKQ